MLSKDQLRKAKLRKESVQIASLDGTVYVRGMTGAELDQWQQESFHRREKSGNDTDPLSTASLVAKTLCDEAGTRIYKDTEVGEVADLPAEVLTPIADVAARLSGITKSAKEEIGKNSSSGQSAGST